MLQIVLFSVSVYLALVFIWYFYRQRYCFLNYLVFALVSIVLIISLAQYFKIYSYLQFLESAHTVYLSSLLGFPLSVWNSSNLLLQSSDLDKTLLHIGIECSSFIEMSIFVILVSFYPIWKGWRKFYYILGGTFYIYVLNLIRILIIVSTVNFLGEKYLFWTHTIFSRLFFFFMMMLLYQIVLTKGALNFTKQTIKERNK